MNALADTCWRRRPHPESELRFGIDAFDATEIRSGDTVVAVGAFVPFLRELKRRRQPFLVLEQDPTTPKPVLNGPPPLTATRSGAGQVLSNRAPQNPRRIRGMLLRNVGEAEKQPLTAIPIYR